MSIQSIGTTEGTVEACAGRFYLVVARWNSFVVENLLEGAVEALRKQGITDDQLHIVRVPGAYEIPLACQHVAERDDCVAVIALGAVIRGGTPHFEYVAGECTRGLSEVQMATGKPVAFGVLTVDNIEQAVERSNPGPGNKGAESALTALEMVNLARALAS